MARVELIQAQLNEMPKSHTRVVRGRVVTRWGDKFEIDTHGRKVDGTAAAVAQAIVEGS